MAKRCEVCGKGPVDVNLHDVRARALKIDVRKKRDVIGVTVNFDREL